jgi:hypothetical protein
VPECRGRRFKSCRASPLYADPVTYPFPPLTPSDITTIAARLGQALQRRYDEIAALEQQIADDIRLGRKAQVLGTLREFRTAVANYQADALQLAEAYVRNDLPRIYESGALRSGGTFAWTQAHTSALISLSSDTYGDFLRRSQEFGQTATRFANRVRRIAQTTLPQMAAGNQTARGAAREFAKQMENEGLRFVTYANGRQVGAGVYAEMAARTKGAVAYNYGTINQATGNGHGWMEVFDGNGCGWTFHDDTEQADGKIVTSDEALAYPISHPNCRRSFGARPDITSKEDAAAGKPSPRDPNNDPTIPPVAVTTPKTTSAADRANSRRATTAARRAAKAQQTSG